MKTSSPQTGSPRGVSLLEMLIGIGLLTLAVPLVLGTLVKSGESGVASRVENRCALIVPACLAEIRAAREGRENLLTGLEAVPDFPIMGEFTCLGFGRRGEPVSKMEPADYDAGLRQSNAKGIYYFACIEAQTHEATSDSPAARRFKISVEYPAAAPVGKRQKLDFYTDMP